VFYGTTNDVDRKCSRGRMTSRNPGGNESCMKRYNGSRKVSSPVLFIPFQTAHPTKVPLLPEECSRIIGNWSLPFEALLVLGSDRCGVPVDKSDQNIDRAATTQSRSVGI
jgi:hypothetical protein